MEGYNDQLKRDTAEYFFKACLKSQLQEKEKAPEYQLTVLKACYSRMQSAYKLIGDQLKGEFEAEVSLGDEDAE